MPDQESPVQQAREAVLDLTLAAFKDCPNPVVEAHANKLVDAFESAVRDEEVDAFNRQPILRHCLHPGCLREFDMGASLGGGQCGNTGPVRGGSRSGPPLPPATSAPTMPRSWSITGPAGTGTPMKQSSCAAPAAGAHPSPDGRATP